jgi:hypothetical protein
VVVDSVVVVSSVVVDVLDEVVWFVGVDSLVVVESVVPRQWSSSTPPWFPWSSHSFPCSG